MRKKTAKPIAAKAKYDASPEEKATIGKAGARKTPGPAPRLRVQDAKISIDHADPVVGWLLLEEALGSSDRDFLNFLLKQLASASAKGGQVDEEDLNVMVSVVKGIEPRDQLRRC